jgi:hypothetical protein
MSIDCYLHRTAQHGLLLDAFGCLVNAFVFRHLSRKIQSLSFFIGLFRLSCMNITIQFIYKKVTVKVLKFTYLES